MSNHIEQRQAEAEKRIVGTFTKQTWGGRKGDDALYCGEEQFDATNAVLELPHAALIELQDGHENTDEIGRSIVDWVGPCEVRLVGSIEAYFGVASLEDVTPKMLSDSRAALELSTHRDPNLVYETGSDDTFWNSKVLRRGGRFDVQVYDADGDRRPEREGSFVDQALAIGFAQGSVSRPAEQAMKVTTLADGTQLQYIKLSDSQGPRWLSHADSLLTTDKPEHARGFLPGEALKIYQNLLQLGYKGLSLTNAVPVNEASAPAADAPLDESTSDIEQGRCQVERQRG